jgi:hypothetical protein
VWLCHLFAWFVCVGAGRLTDLLHSVLDTLILVCYFYLL